MSEFEVSICLLRDDWWRNMVVRPPDGPDGHPLSIVGLDSAIIQNPRAWVASATGAVLAKSLLGKSKDDARRS